MERPRHLRPRALHQRRNEDASHKHAWTAFGGNVHKCIGMHFGGMEVKAILQAPDPASTPGSERWGERLMTDHRAARNLGEIRAKELKMPKVSKDRAAHVDQYGPVEDRERTSMGTPSASRPSASTSTGSRCSRGCRATRAHAPLAGSRRLPMEVTSVSGIADACAKSLATAKERSVLGEPPGQEWD
jgi:hypothetical protein